MSQRRLIRNLGARLQDHRVREQVIDELAGVGVTCFHFGRFRPLSVKIQQVMGWPGVSEWHSRADFDKAVEEAEDTGRLRRFREQDPARPTLDVVVSVHLGSLHETMTQLALPQLQAVLGNGLKDDVSPLVVGGSTQQFIPYKDVPVPIDCVTVDVIDLSANWSGTWRDCLIKMRQRRSGLSPATPSNRYDAAEACIREAYLLTSPPEDAIPEFTPTERRAHAAAVFALVEDSQLVQWMPPHTGGMPHIVVGGCALCSTVEDDRGSRLLLHSDAGSLRLSIIHPQRFYPMSSMPAHVAV